MKHLQYILIILITFSFGCTSNHSDHNHDGSDQLDHSHNSIENQSMVQDSSQVLDDHQNGLISLSSEQVDAIGLTFGSMSDVKVDNFITANGLIGLPPNAYTGVNSKIEGIVRNSKKFVEGSYIQQGEFVATIENPMLIEKQQEYLEINSRVTFMELEAQRQQDLRDSGAAVEKTFQKAISDLEIAKSKKAGLKKYLEYVGIDIDQISNDNLMEKVSIFAPASGFLTSVNLYNGMYVNLQHELLQIMKKDHLHLELDVFEKDIAFIEKGQRITYVIPALGAKRYEGKIEVIGKEFDQKNKTIRVHGHLEGDIPKFVKDLYVNAKIWTSDNSVDALPEDAVISDGDESFIFAGKKVDEEFQFKKILVKSGASDNGYMAVTLFDEIPEGYEIVIEGAYYVYAQSKTDELDHDH